MFAPPTVNTSPSAGSNIPSSQPVQPGGGRSQSQLNQPDASGQDQNAASQNPDVSVVDSSQQASIGTPLGDIGVSDAIVGMATLAAPTHVGLGFKAAQNFGSAMEALGITQGPYGVTGKAAIAPQMNTPAWDAVMEAMGVAETNNAIHGAREEHAEDDQLGDMSTDVDAETEAEQQANARSSSLSATDAQAAQNDAEGIADNSNPVGTEGAASQGGSEAVGPGSTGNDGGSSARGMANQEAASAGQSSNDGGSSGGSSGGHGADSGYGGPDGVGRGNDRGGGIGFLKGGLVTDQDPSTLHTEQKFANISEGEFVFSRAAVQYYGLKKLEDMNNKAIEHFGTPDPRPTKAPEAIFQNSSKKGVDKNKKPTTPKSQNNKDRK
jgi:hypothetical protein